MLRLFQLVPAVQGSWNKNGLGLAKTEPRGIGLEGSLQHLVGAWMRIPMLSTDWLASSGTQSQFQLDSAFGTTTWVLILGPNPPSSLPPWTAPMQRGCICLDQPALPVPHSTADFRVNKEITATWIILIVYRSRGSGQIWDQLVFIFWRRRRWWCKDQRKEGSSLICASSTP